MRKLILLILLPFAYMVRVEAQTLTATVDGYFNPVGNYEPGDFVSGIGFESRINGWHENADGTVEVFTNFDTLDGQFIDYSFVIDGETWYPSSAPEGTYSAFIFKGEKFMFGKYGVSNSQEEILVPVTWSPYGSGFIMSYVDEERDQVILIEQLEDNPEDDWDEPVNNIILWDGENYETIGTGMTSLTSILPVDSGNSILITSSSNNNPCFYKVDLIEKMMVSLSENEDLNQPPGASDWNNGVIFLGRPTVTGHFFGHGMAVTSLTENGWEENVIELDAAGFMYLDDTKNKLFYCSSENEIDATGNYMSGLSFTENLTEFVPVVDKRGAYCSDGNRLIPLFSKGTMWLIGKQHGSFNFSTEEDGNYYDVYVLKDTYTPYTTAISEEKPSGFLVHPNPATEEFIYGLPYEANLFALDGKIVKTISKNESSVYVGDIPSGMYVLTLADGSRSQIVITH